jgi:hypothetical protein
MNLTRCTVAARPIKELAWDTGLRSIPTITIDVLGDVDHVIVKIVEYSHERPVRRAFLYRRIHEILSLIIPAQSPSSDDGAVKTVGAGRDQKLVFA